MTAAARTGAAGAAVASLPFGAVSLKAQPDEPVLVPAQRTTLDAALARMIPADGPDDWSAADLGAGNYIERLLSGDGEIYAGGPTRESFPSFAPLTRAKEMGWAAEVDRLRALYADGLAELDRRAGGSFADAAEPIQDLILTTLDIEGSAFFAVLYHHTMEAVYGHPVYGGNSGYRAWKDLCYQGDVHGVRFPSTGSPGAWNLYGGYAPEEMIVPGMCPGQGPVE